MFRKVILLILLIFLIAFYTMAPITMDVTTMTILLGVVSFSTILYFTNKERIFELKGQFLKHTNLVVIGLLIVHFQLYIDFVLGNINKEETFIWVNQNIVIKSLILSTIGLNSFFLGSLFYKSKFQYVVQTLNNKKESYNSVKFLLYLATIVLAIYFYTVNPLYLLGFYGLEDMGVTATYMSLLFNLLIFAVIIQSSRNLRIQNKIPANFMQYIKFMNYHLLLLLVVYLFSVMISGDRGPLITYGLCYVSGYFFVKRVKLSYKKGLLFMLIGALMITVLGVVRSLDKSLSFTDKIQQSFSENVISPDISFLPPTKELASSVRTVHYALDYVPQNHDFLYGRFQLQQVMVVLPFFSVLNSLIFEDTSSKYKGSSSFITWIHQGDYPTYGDGTSCVADFYLDFGLVGVLVGMFVFGYFMSLAEVKMYTINKPSLFLHVFIIVYLCSAIYIARSSVLFGFKDVVWIFWVLIFNKYVINKRRSFK